MTAKKNDELKSCSCGGKAITRQDGLWYAECSVCGEYEGPHAYKREAVKMWNKRNGAK